MSAEGIRRWYNPPWYSEKIPSTPYDPKVLREAFEKACFKPSASLLAVLKRLITDVPFGVLLSGGLDSSLVVAVAARYLAYSEAACQWGSQLHTFCIGLKGSPDLKAAREVSAYIGTFHHEFHFTVQEGIDALEEVIYHIETWEGSDEIFGGYLYFHKSSNKEEFHEETCQKECTLIVNAFDDDQKPYLTKHILYRQKEQFSDGVGYRWIDGLKDHAEKQVTDAMLMNASFYYPENTPTTKEGYYYRTIFEKFFPKNAARSTVPGDPSVACNTAKAVAWDAAWSKNPDPSGRAALGIHASAYEEAADANAMNLINNPSRKIQKGIEEKIAAA
ncbi:Asparagine synthetase 2 [Hibiscus syriacus]|uniref:Asparagine synthetase 2 n=1 Tax=Hibiscus syriacus TaxID=106335 RepID=A0A6A2X826_HIBSY|nr:Asparagine synthetase 2 [Hibiscus syriacus]